MRCGTFTQTRLDLAEDRNIDEALAAALRRALDAELERALYGDRPPPAPGVLDLRRRPAARIDLVSRILA